MNASAVMDPNPTVLRPTDKISTAASFIMENRYRNLPVVDEDRRPIGMVRIHDLVKLGVA